MISHRISGWLIIALNACILFGHCTAEAQDKTDPYEHPHPTTGEPGVWIPVWLQQVELARKAELESCKAEREAKAQEAAERAQEAASLRSANLEVTEANSGLKELSAAQGLRLGEAQEDADARLIWAWTSTGAAVVAISVIVLQAAL
jgi:hypothetical protein